MIVYKILAQIVQKSMDGGSKEVFKRFLKGLGGVLYRGGRETLKKIPAVGVVLEGTNIPTEVNDSKDERQDYASISEMREALGQSVLIEVWDCWNPYNRPWLSSHDFKVAGTGRASYPMEGVGNSVWLSDGGRRQRF